METQGYQRKRKYILTCDLKHKFSQFEHVGLKVPDEVFFDEFDEKIKEFIQSAYPNDEVISFDIEDLAADILSTATQKETGLDGFIISTCVDMAVPRRGATLEINRLFDSEGKFIGLGTRPGHISIEDQFQKVAEAAKGRPAILVEDGTFSGDTLTFILWRMKQLKVDIQIVVVGFAFSRGMDKIREAFGGEIIAVNELDSLIDWIPDHDFFPFAPNCGRVLGVNVNGSNYPFYDYRGVSFSVPYIRPFISERKMESWTCIPNIDKLHYRFSGYCLTKAIEYYNLLNELNHKKISVEHLMGVRPRVNVPIEMGCRHFPSVNTEIARYLHDVVEEGFC